MSKLIRSLGIDRLAPEEQLKLVGEILDGLAPGSDAELPISEAQRLELDRRIALIEADPSRLIPLEEVEQRIQARLRN